MLGLISTGMQMLLRPSTSIPTEEEFFALPSSYLSEQRPAQQQTAPSARRPVLQLARE
jgi:hypothetical protein